MLQHDENKSPLDAKEVAVIYEEYRKRKLLEGLTGPVVSTLFHVLLVVILGIYMIDAKLEKVKEVAITLLPQEDPIPPIVPIVPPPVQPIPDKTVTPNLTLTVLSPETLPLETALVDTNQAENESDDKMDKQEFSDVVISPSAFADPTALGGRTNTGIKERIKDFGPKTTPTYPAFLKSLEWLAKVQNADGSWGDNAKSAYTGLALLTFLAHGETNTSKRYGNTVSKAMKWLVNDPIDTKSHHGYPHAIKTYALSEAYAMTGVSLIEAKMDECVEVIIKGQQKGGAFDYNYSANENRQDLSFAGWNYQALKAANVAGCEVAGLNDAIYKSVEYLKIMGGSSKSFAYTTSNNDPSTAKQPGKWTMVAVGTLALELLDHAENKILKDELDKILSEGKPRFNWNNPPKDALYGWYYETNVMFHAQGKYWKEWRELYGKVLIENQHPEGYWVSPGHSNIPGNELSQKVYATTLVALTLSVPFRYLPSISQTAIAKKTENKKPGIEEVLDLIE